MTADPIALQAELERVQQEHVALEHRFRHTLEILEIAPEAIDRIVAGEEIESDYLTASDFRNLEAINQGILPHD